MKIVFCLGWTENPAKAFKSAAAFELFREYAARIDKFDRCSVSKLGPAGKSASKLWLCHRSPHAKTLSSEELASALQKIRDSAVQELRIAIGPADGFTAADLKNLAPDLIWSFGPMTLPHELAAVVASEQVYRAYTILQRLPYHSGH